MLTHETKIRVYYEDTDQMGVVYYGVYPRYYEIGRTEMMRDLSISYVELEKTGIMLPARSMKVNYLKSAHYDDLLTIRTSVAKIPQVKFPIRTEIYNQNQELINEGEVVLAFFNQHTGKPCRAPLVVVDRLKDHF